MQSKMGAIVLLLLISFVHSLVTSQDINLCPDGPVKDRYLKVHGDFCYQFVVYRKYTHSEAKTDCELQGGSLVLVKTADIQNFVYQQLITNYNDAYDRVWIGLNDLAQEDHYVWEDGTKLGFYSNWYQGEGPSSTTANHNFTHITRDCVVMDISPSIGGKWRESSCESSAALLVLSAREAHSYVCQYSIISTTDYSTTSYYYSTTSTDFLTNTEDFSTTTSDYSTTTSDYSSADFSTTKKAYPSSTADFPTTTSDSLTTTSDYSTTTSDYSTTDFSTTKKGYPSSTADYSTTTSDYFKADFSTTTKGYPSSTADYSTTTSDYSTADFSTTKKGYPSSTADYSTTTSDYSTADFSTTKKGYPSSTADYSTTTSDYSTADFSTTKKGYPSSTTDFSTTTSDYSTTTSEYSTSV